MKISIVGYSLMAVGIAPVLSETIHGVVVFIRHGDSKCPSIAFEVAQLKGYH